LNKSAACLAAAEKVYPLVKSFQADYVNWRIQKLSDQVHNRFSLQNLRSCRVHGAICTGRQWYPKQCCDMYAEIDRIYNQTDFDQKDYEQNYITRINADKKTSEAWIEFEEKCPSYRATTFVEHMTSHGIFLIKESVEEQKSFYKRVQLEKKSALSSLLKLIEKTNQKINNDKSLILSTLSNINNLTEVNEKKTIHTFEAIGASKIEICSIAIPSASAISKRQQNPEAACFKYDLILNNNQKIVHIKLDSSETQMSDKEFKKAGFIRAKIVFPKFVLSHDFEFNAESLKNIPIHSICNPEGDVLFERLERNEGEVTIPYWKEINGDRASWIFINQDHDFAAALQKGQTIIEMKNLAQRVGSGLLTLFEQESHSIDFWFGYKLYQARKAGDATTIGELNEVNYQGFEATAPLLIRRLDW
jgi:hypothetical protein